VDLAFGPPLRASLTSHLSRFERRPLSLEARRAAAVGLVVVPGPGDEAAVLLTVRARGLTRHGGQFACPGGRADPGESASETALRELREELGLELGADAVLGLLDDYPTRSGFLVTPVVLWGTGGELRLDPGEVAEVHRVPLAELTEPGNLRLHGGGEARLLALQIAGSLVFSPTAALLHQFGEVAVLGRDTRVAHFEQPRFAWR
jgi:8-oxo-dGTP pyrophosphatase MutT (NUDIX family)